MLRTVRVFAIAPILGAATGLHISRFPRLRAERASKSRSVRSARTDFHVVRLQQRAALLVPVLLEGENDWLKGKHDAPECLERCGFYRKTLHPNHSRLARVGHSKSYMT